MYAATASGGLWKTVNNGQSWNSLFDNENIISIGAVAVDQQDTSVVWVGSGEANNSRSSYWVTEFTSQPMVVKLGQYGATRVTSHRSYSNRSD